MCRTCSGRLSGNEDPLIARTSVPPSLRWIDMSTEAVAEKAAHGMKARGSCQRSLHQVCHHTDRSDIAIDAVFDRLRDGWLALNEYAIFR